MNTTKIEFAVLRGRSPATRILTAILLTGMTLISAGGCTTATQAGYASPEDAVNSLVSSLRTNDRAQLHRILGPGSDEILSSGDEIADRNAAEKFLQAYDIKHSLTTNEDGSMTLVVGGNDWPTPIPIYKNASSGQWLFDTDAGKDEMISRRIGRNELDVIQVCQAIVDAEQEYTLHDPDGDGIHQYAQKVISDPGKKNGLYWPTAEGEAPSPLGPLVADAMVEGYTAARGANGQPKPFHGYYYRMLTSQGPNAPGGAHDYIANGRMIGGFAIEAHPAEYGKSGIMTFIVNKDGIVYQRDLGPETATLAKAIKSYDPGPEWKKAE